MKNSSFCVYALVVLLVCGTLGVTVKLWTLTNVPLVVEVPEGGDGKLQLQPPLGIVDYLDWLFVSASVIALATLYLNERFKNNQVTSSVTSTMEINEENG